MLFEVGFYPLSNDFMRVSFDLKATNYHIYFKQSFWKYSFFFKIPAIILPHIDSFIHFKRELFTDKITNFVKRLNSYLKLQFVQDPFMLFNI
jgi:hypothetical protein